MATDRVCLRRPQDRSLRDLERELSWNRQLSVRITLEDPDRWQGAERELAETLRFLTDDNWIVNFVGGATAQPHQERLFQRELPPEREVALFSGGLDSLAGALARLRATEDPHHLVLVSEYGQPVRRGLITKALTGLPIEAASRQRVSWVGLHYQLRDSPDDEREEGSQWSRGFLFFSIAAAVAATMGTDRVASFETGIGGLNPAMNAAQAGALNTRSMHPRTLTLLERLFARVLDRPMALDLPFFFKTKGELCTEVGDGLTEAVRLAVSCDEGERAKRRDDIVHCGFCTSCLFRRSALWYALRGVDPTPYRGTSAEAEAAYTIEAYRQHATALARAATSWRQVMGVDPSMRFAVERFATNASDRKRVEGEILSLVQRHSNEVLAFLAAARPRVERRANPATETSHDLF